jgi:predicted secreted protein
MSKIKEVIVEAVLPAIKAVGKVEMKIVLSGIKEHNTPEIYRNTIQGLYSNFSLLKEAAFKTRSKIDDGIVELVLEAVKDSADSDGISLS